MNERMSKRIEIEYGSHLASMCVVALSLPLLFYCVFSIYLWHCEQFLYYTEPSVFHPEWMRARAQTQNSLECVYRWPFSISRCVYCVVCKQNVQMKTKKNHIKDNVQVARPFVTVSPILLLRTTYQNTHHTSVERLHATAKQATTMTKRQLRKRHLGN